MDWALNPPPLEQQKRATEDIALPFDRHQAAAASAADTNNKQAAAGEAPLPQEGLASPQPFQLRCLNGLFASLLRHSR